MTSMYPLSYCGYLKNLRLRLFPSLCWTMTSCSLYWMPMTSTRICSIIKCRMEILLYRCLFLELIPPKVAGPSPTLIWFTLRGTITADLALRNAPWPSHLEAPRRPDCCFWSNTVLTLTRGEMMRIAISASNSTKWWCFLFICAIYHSSACVIFVQDNPRP
jgi:hypothetical protein